MHGNILPKQSVSVQIFHKFQLKPMCFSQYFNMHMYKFYQTLCFGREKTARTVLDQKCFSHIFIKFYQNKCVSVSILICARINSTKTLCFGRKKQQRTVLDQKCFCKIFIKFYWKKCVSVNISICAWKNSTKTLCFGRNKNSKTLCLIKSVSVQIFHKVLLKEMCFSQIFNVHM